jgi:hypothetical protein
MDFKKPKYSLSVAHTLSVASKLAYEDVAVVKYELELGGYDVENTFKGIGYKVSLKAMQYSDVKDKTHYRTIL